MKDIILKNLEISETMFTNANDKYLAVAKLLYEKMNGAIVYPQGSFAIGTTVRPYKGGEDLSYDIDLILVVDRDKASLTGSYLLNDIYEILISNDLYKGKLEKSDKSITINYADIEGIGFNLDIVPAVIESDEIKKELLEQGCKYEYVQDAISISSLDEKDKNGWYTAIPKAYFSWFEDINSPYKNYMFEKIKRDKYGKVVYNSIEEVPHYKIKTPVQEVVQIIKRLRDVHYYKIDEYDKKPISAILTTIVAKVAFRNKNYEITTFDLLRKVIMELKNYKLCSSLSKDDFQIRYPGCVDIFIEDKKWKMINPVNPKDNLVDSWNKDRKVSVLFFEWLDIIEKELGKLLINSEDVLTYENLFGSKFISKILGLEFKNNDVEGPKPYGEC